MACAATALAAARVVVPQLPPSPYDDTEISTNVVFSAGRDDSRLFSLSLSVDATPSNTVQIAFGSDGDSDGVLSWRETDGGDDIGFVVTPGMFRPNWNLMRVTVRGMPGPVFAAEGEVSAPGFSMRVR